MHAKRILMATDFSDFAQPALDQAIFLAQDFQAELHLLHVVVLYGAHVQDPLFVSPDLEQVCEQFEKVAYEQMDELVSGRSLGPVDLVQAHGRGLAAAPAIVEYAKDQSVDLIVVGTHGRRGLRRFFLGSVAEEVVRTAGCPVLTVPGRSASAHDETSESATEQRIPMQRIVVPYDFSDDSDEALRSAKELASIYGSCIDLVHVIAPPMAPGGVEGMPMGGLVRSELSSAVRKALNLRAENSPGPPEVAMECHVLEGPAPWRVTEFAKKVEADLIVMGSHGLSGLRRFLLGSVCERVVRSAHCPVLVLRSETPEEGEDATS